MEGKIGFESRDWRVEIVGEWRGHGEKGRDLVEEAEGGQYKSDHGRLKTQN